MRCCSTPVLDDLEYAGRDGDSRDCNWEGVNKVDRRLRHVPCLKVDGMDAEPPVLHVVYIYSIHNHTQAHLAHTYHTKPKHHYQNG